MRNEIGPVAAILGGLLVTATGCGSEPAADGPMPAVSHQVASRTFDVDGDHLSVAVHVRTRVPDDSRRECVDKFGSTTSSRTRVVRSDYYVADYARSADDRWRLAAVRPGTGDEGADPDASYPERSADDLDRLAADPAAAPAWRAALTHAAAFARGNEPATRPTTGPTTASAGHSVWSFKVSADHRWIVADGYFGRHAPAHVTLAGVEYPPGDLFVFGVDVPAGRAFDEDDWPIDTRFTVDPQVGSAHGRLQLLFRTSGGLVLIEPFTGGVQRSPPGMPTEIPTDEPFSWDADAGRVTVCCDGWGVLKMTDWWYDQGRVTTTTFDLAGLHALDGDAKPVATTW